MRSFALPLLLLAATAAHADLVSSWRAEGNTLDSIGANHGVGQGTFGYEPTSFGQGFDFDSAGYIDVPNPAAGGLASPTGFTVFAVFRFDGPSTGASVASIMNLRSPANTSGFTLEQSFSDPNGVNFYVNTSGTTAFHLLSTNGWQFGTTYSVAATFDAASHTMKLYRNGSLLATSTSVPGTNMVVNGTESFQIGRNIPGNSVFNGMIDEAQFYNTALSDAQVAAITPVPEPASLAVLGLGGLALLRRRKR